jgi:hypothetical protein
MDDEQQILNLSDANNSSFNSVRGLKHEVLDTVDEELKSQSQTNFKSDAKLKKFKTITNNLSSGSKAHKLYNNLLMKSRLRALSQDSKEVIDDNLIDKYKNVPFGKLITFANQLSLNEYNAIIAIQQQSEKGNFDIERFKASLSKARKDRAHRDKDQRVISLKLKLNEVVRIPKDIPAEREEPSYDDVYYMKLNSKRSSSCLGRASMTGFSPVASRRKPFNKYIMKAASQFMEEKLIVPKKMVNTNGLRMFLKERMLKGGINIK